MKDDVDTMSKKIKSLLISVMLLVIVFLFCACGGNQTQFEVNDEAGYTVSVKFDANGGEFTTNCSVIVDSFNISGMATNSNGMVELALISPDNTVRGSTDTYTVAKNGYFLAGWYATRNEIVDGNGNVTYTYADKWDFENGLLQVDPNKQYNSSEPVITLYAAWVPKFTVNYYSLDTKELLYTDSFAPAESIDFRVPEWNTETGAIEMYDFPARKGHTFQGAYYDAEGAQQILGAIEHPGQVDYTNGTAVNASLDVYVDWIEGEWYRIYNAEQLVDNATRNGYYELYADLDFTDLNWPTVFMYGDFNGAIIGNDHTISNVTVTQTDNAKTRFGLFGSLTAEATVQDVVFQNITAIIQSGARTSGIAYGLFAGNISAEANISGVQILSSQLQIDSGCVLTSKDYVFGLVCGMGDFNAVDVAEIAVVAVGDNPESVTINVDESNGTLTVVIG